MLMVSHLGKGEAGFHVFSALRYEGFSEFRQGLPGPLSCGSHIWAGGGSEEGGGPLEKDHSFVGPGRGGVFPRAREAVLPDGQNPD